MDRAEPGSACKRRRAGWFARGGRGAQCWHAVQWCSCRWLAARSGAAVIPGFAIWEPAESRYVLRFYPAIEITGDAHADTQRLHSLLESVIRGNPGQWLWIHRRWKTRPPGEGPVY